jgi:hypothetical protein
MLRRNIRESTDDFTTCKSQDWAWLWVSRCSSKCTSRHLRVPRVRRVRRFPITIIYHLTIDYRLNNDEVSQKAAVASACISQNDFTKALNVVRKALGPMERQQTRGLNYRSLIGTYRVAPAEEALEWMREAESSIPKVDMLRARHRASAVTCAIFYWICQIMEVCTVYPSIKGFLAHFAFLGSGDARKITL